MSTPSLSLRLLGVLGLGAAGLAHAAAPNDGYLDTSWGLFGSGKSLVPFDLGGDLLDQAAGSALGSDGSLFLAGTVKDANGIKRMGVAKLKPDGTLDTSGFGGGDGRVLSATNAGTLVATALVRRNTTLYVAGYREVNATNRDFALCVFSTAGVPLSFLGTGTSCVTASFDLGPTISQDMAYDLAVQPDGKIVLAGTTAVNSSSDTYAAFVRFNANGLLDGSFGLSHSGQTLLRTSNVFQRHRVRAVAVASNGKIVAVGSTDVVGASDTGALVIRLNSDGSPDPLSNTDELTFAVDGSSSRDTVLNDVLLEDVADAADDRMVVVGYAQTAGNPTGANRLIARLAPAGSFDASFSGGDGSDGYDISGGAAGTYGVFESVAAAPGGGAYFPAGTFSFPGEPSDLNVCRYRADGGTETFFEGLSACKNVDFSLPGAFETGAEVQVMGDGIYLSGTGFKTASDGDFVAAKFTVDRIFRDRFE